MDERYRAIYDAIYGARITGEFPPELFTAVEANRPLLDTAGRVGAAIDEAERQLPEGGSFRPDARALLALNFIDLVTVPLLAGGAVPDYEIFDDVRADIAMLASRARTDGERPGEISGHAIVDSLSQNWSELRISRFRLWEREYE